MARYGLDLQQKNKNGRKTKIILVSVFLCFALILGSVSTLLLWRSLNYDFNNIFNREDVSTTLPPKTTAENTVVYDGESTFLVAVTSDDMKKIRFINLVDVDLGEKLIKVIPVDHSQKIKSQNKTYSKLLSESGIKTLVTAVEEQQNCTVSRYVLLTDSGYKSLYRAMGDITVKVREHIEYDTEDMFLELEKGENVLSPEKTYKYMKYLCETKKPYECSLINAEVIVSSFNAFMTPDKFLSADSRFSQVINYCDTDISIVDYTENKDKIEYLIPQTSKEKLKVYAVKELENE